VHLALFLALSISPTLLLLVTYCLDFTAEPDLLEASLYANVHSRIE